MDASAISRADIEGDIFHKSRHDRTFRSLIFSIDGRAFRWRHMKEFLRFEGQIEQWKDFLDRLSSGMTEVFWSWYLASRNKAMVLKCVA